MMSERNYALPHDQLAWHRGQLVFVCAQEGGYETVVLRLPDRQEYIGWLRELVCIPDEDQEAARAIWELQQDSFAPVR